MKKYICHALSMILTTTVAIADDPYKKSQDEAIARVELFLSEIKDGSLISKKNKVVFTDRELHYLNGAYLYCTLKNGVCLFLLQAILESDIINSQIDGKENCSNMLKFWKGWLNNALERRVDHSLSTGLLPAYFEFKEKTRPSFLNCSSTVKENIDPDKSLSDFVKGRYSEDGEAFKSINTLLGYINGLKEQVKDVYVSAGAYK